jgi:membrane-associated protease RseP (regulator of RpoE activity)
MEEENKLKKYSFHTGLFILTFFTTTLAGKDWMGLADISWWDGFFKGMEYSIPFLGILTIHEFGHYITARRHGAKVSLPYFIPFYLPFVNTFGTFGAFIRILSAHKSRTEVFDIGIAGPLSGFVAAMILLFYGFTHLPEPEYIYKVHKQYQEFGLDYPKHVYNYDFAVKEHHEAFKTDSMNFEKQQDEDSLKFVAEQRAKGNKNNIIFNKKKYENGRAFEPYPVYSTLTMGKNLIFLFFENFVADNPSLVPNKYELFHYPFIFAGYLALFFTAFNLFPIGQLDGGHITYGLFGTKYHRIISVSVFISFVYLAGVGIFRNNVFADAFASVSELLIFAPLYIYLLYLIFSKITDSPTTNLMIAVSVFAAQFFTELILPEFEGFNGWFLFAFLIGRFLGVNHPEAYDESPISLNRKVLGWTALVIFVLCFTPQLLDVEMMVKP